MAVMTPASPTHAPPTQAPPKHDLPVTVASGATFLGPVTVVTVAPKSAPRRPSGRSGGSSTIQPDHHDAARGVPPDAPTDKLAIYYHSPGYMSFPVTPSQVNHTMFLRVLAITKDLAGGTVITENVNNDMPGNRQYMATIDSTLHGTLILGLTSAPSRSLNTRLASCTHRFYVRGIRKYARDDSRVCGLLAAYVDVFSK